MRSAHLGLASAGMLAALALAACSGNSLLTTGTTKPLPPPQPATPKERAMHAAVTTAQAARCGYNFDPGRLRAGYLAWESQQGTSASEAAALEKVYDSTRGRVAAAITKPEEYCTDEVTERVKRDLGKQLAGDFSAPMKKPEVPWWQSSGVEQKFDREKVFNPGAIK